ncbi:DUF1236 domain-containing protein [Bradyrhizobium prioriisuperbiae]|uniref:DUF1236 domain-containing protein n=1 Tax=Bradyrhizobium prioriisuperbiae TaxID=2854389 RepID=UPI0028EF7EDC|nr:DUF1236 domain-containing protein [Bradyrhizobium prioritasuperba]
MMKTTLLSTVAAIGLAVSLGAASAQAPSERGGAAGGTASGSMERGGASGSATGDHKSGMTEQSPSKAGTSEQRAQTPANKADGRPEGKNAQAPAANDGKANSKMSSDKMAPDHSAQKTGDAKQGTDSSKQGADSKSGTNAQSQPGSKSTVGAASSSETKMTSEQRTQIREKVIATGPRVTNVNFSLNVGTVVPRTVQVVDVPTVIIDMHPEWRGYRYFVVNDQVIIVERDSLRIVAVLDV